MKILHLFTERPDGRKDWQWMTWRWDTQYEEIYQKLRAFRNLGKPTPDYQQYPNNTYGAGGSGGIVTTTTSETSTYYEIPSAVL